MQAIDQASRGLWGSLQPLCGCLRRTKMNSLILLRAFMRILALAIGPFTQQILSFPGRSFHATNQSAWIQITNKYISPDLIGPNPELQEATYYLDSSMTKAIMNGLIQDIKPLAPYLGSTNCDSSQFVSMGICSHCTDVTAQAHRSCVPTDNFGRNNILWQCKTMTNCTYTTPGGYELSLNLNDFLTTGEMITAEYSADFMSLNLTYWGTIIGITDEMEIDTIVSLLAANLPMTLVMYHSDSVTEMLPMPTLTECSVYCCEKQYSPSSYFLGQQENFSVNASNTQPLIPIHGNPRYRV